LSQRILDPKSIEDKNILDSIWYFEKIQLEINNNKYVLIIQKVLRNSTLFKYVVWIYKTDDDYTIKPNGNKLRNIYDITDFNTLDKIVTKIKESKKLFPDTIKDYTEFPNPENIFINKCI
jgi:hypothetical protein